MLSQLVSELPVPDLFYVFAMVRNNNGFMSIGVLQLYMGAVLADNFCISFPTSNSF